MRVRFIYSRRRFTLTLCALVLGLTGCSSIEPLPKVNLQEPGWTAKQGQAIWHLEHGTREVAGDLIVATGPNDQAFVQFSKTPFPLVIAQSDRTRWSVEFPPQNKRYSGRGKPPQRLIWLYLPQSISGKPPPANWTWQEAAGQWHLTNRANGESVEGYFSP